MPLAAILFYLVYKGASSLNLAFFTQVPAPVGEPGGGMANSIVGSGVILLLASLMGIPIGIAAGVYLAEFGRGKMLANAVRFTADVLNGVPSIVMGIAIYSLVVMPQKHFSALAGGIVLAIMMIPTVTRTTEEMLSTVPHAVREAALGLGVPKWRTVLSVSLRTASPGIITGCMLAFARVAGETAPLLFTAFGNQFWSFKLNEPIAALPLQIFVYAISPYDEWHRLAWAGSLVLIAYDYGFSHARPHLCQPRRTQGRKLVGVGIQVENLNAWYGTNHTLQDINLHIPANHATALIGPSGCGKSTFVRCLNRMHETNPIARATGIGQDGRSRYLQGCIAGGDSPPRRHGLSAAQSLSDDVDLRQRRQRTEAQWLSQQARARRDGRALAEAGGAVGRGEGRSEEEVRRQPLRRTAAAHVHRARSCGRSRGAC